MRLPLPDGSAAAITQHDRAYAYDAPGRVLAASTSCSVDITHSHDHLDRRPSADHDDTLPSTTRRDRHPRRNRCPSTTLTA